MTRNRWVAVWLVALGVPCCHAVFRSTDRSRYEEGWLRSAHRLSEIRLGLENYHDTYLRLPPAVVRDKDGRPLYSWRVLLLPFVEQDHVYRKFKLDEPWDGPNNRLLLSETPRCYEPALGGRDAPGLTRYQALVGPGTAFERDGLTWADFPDGPASTLMVVESGVPVPWSAPVDLAYDPAGPLPPLGGAFTKPARLAGYEVRREPGFCGVLGEDRGRFFRRSVGGPAIRAFITRNGGEAVDVSVFD